MPTKGLPKDLSLEIVFTSTRDDDGVRKRALDLMALSRKVSPKAAFAFCAPGTAPLKNSRRVSLPVGISAQGALVAAVPASPARCLLFWPASLAPDPTLFRNLSALANSGQWVVGARGSVPPQASALQRRLGLSQAVDLGGALLAPRSGLLNVGQLYDPGAPLLSLRILSKAVANGHGLRSAGASSAALSVPEAMGWGPEKALLLKQRALGLGLGFLAILLGTRLTYPAGLAVALVGIGILVVGYQFGRAE